MENATRQESSLRAGVVGLGMIGGGVATSLATSGRVPLVFDIRPEAADLPGDPELCPSPADVAARSDVVMVAVVTAEQAFEVITGPDGLLSRAHEGLTIALLSTVSLPAVRELAEICRQRGVTLLDCGVTPGDKAAENGMVVMVGGDDDAVARARPVLNDFAKAVVHCGPLGAGMATKLARNVVTYGSWRTVKEAEKLAASAGVSAQTLLDVITTADPDGTTLLMLLRMQQQDASGRIGNQVYPLMTKDLAAAERLASDTELDLPLVHETLAHAADTLGVAEPEEPSRDGRRVMDEVYGPGFSQSLPEHGDPFMEETAEHLFGQVWSRPGLSIRDRRLLVLGATASLGDSSLIETQVKGALANDELTAEQLDEIVLHLAYYVGWGRATAVHRGIAAAVKNHAPEDPDRDLS